MSCFQLLRELGSIAGRQEPTCALQKDKVDTADIGSSNHYQERRASIKWCHKVQKPIMSLPSRKAVFLNQEGVRD